MLAIWWQREISSALRLASSALSAAWLAPAGVIRPQLEPRSRVEGGNSLVVQSQCPRGIGGFLQMVNKLRQPHPRACRLHEP